MATVKLTNVRKVYDKNYVAVKDFNLEIADREFVVFVGPSGCGKSTTLRMIAGLEEISGGEITIGGRVVNRLEPRDRDIAMVFQNYALYPHLTVFENMAFPLRLKKVKNDEVYRRVTESAEVLGITEYLTRKPRALSGGQKQRVAIGRAMVREAQVFLMDEPLSNLDAKLRGQMRSEIILLRKKINSTFIYVTHDQTEAMTLGDRIVVMRDGEIQQVGTPEEVFERPSNIFVAEFIGAPKMNMIRGRYICRNGRCYVTVLGTDIPVLGRRGERILEQKIGERDVIVGIRPEHISISQNGESAFPVVVKVSEMLGGELYLHTRASDGTHIGVRVPTLGLSSAERAAMREQNEILLALDSTSIHLFDPETEKSLV